MNLLQFTSEEQASFNQALRYGRAYLATLNDYQKARLTDLALEKQYRAVQVHTSRFEQYPYAPQEPGQLDYWLDNAPAYVESKQVLALLAEPAASTIEAVIQAIAQPQKTVKTSNRAGKAVLQRGLRLEHVKAIFDDIRPFAHTKSDWGTAIAALHSGGYLIGSADRLEAWIKAEQFGIEISDKTISNCIKAYKDELAFSKDEQNIIDSVLSWAEAKTKC